MNTFPNILLVGILSFMFMGADAHGVSVKEVKKEIESYGDKFPGIGLISKRISFDGITISNFTFDNGENAIFVHPGDKVSTHFNYIIDASKLKTLHLHHFIIGLEGSGPQDCVLHTLGIKNSSGEANVILTAPKKAGAYPVRFCHSQGLTDDQARAAWWNGEGPSGRTIVGVMIVE